MSATTIDNPRQPILNTRIATMILFGFVAYTVFFGLFPSLSRAFPFEWAFYGDDRPAPLADPFVDRTINFYYALMGAMMTGWFTTIVLAMRSGLRIVWDAAIAGLAVWFVLDNAGSFIYGYPMNVVTNAAFVVVLLPTLLLSRPAA
ncbi:MAG: hypothetical protein AAF511_01120 [Pseudomonadota bacterium]